MIPPLFVDENVGRRVMECLQAHGFDLKTHDDIGLPRGTVDEDWIAAVADRGWAAITDDIKQSRKANEWRAIRRGPLKHVVIHAKKMTAAIAVDILNEHVTAFKVVLAYLPAPFTLRLLQSNVQLRSYHDDYESVARANPRG